MDAHRTPEEDRRPLRARRHHRPGLRRPAARARLRRGRLPGHRLRRRPEASRGPRARRVLHQAHRRGARRARRSGAGASPATTDFDGLPRCDAILICVPTPLGRHREPDLSYIREHGRRRSRRVCGPGSWSCSSRRPTRARRARSCCRASRRRGLAARRDFFLAFSPEREDPGNQSFHTQNIPKVVGGVDAASQRGRGGALRRGRSTKVVPVSSARGRRGGEAAREHLPRGQHRARQRAEDRPSTAWASTSGR